MTTLSSTAMTANQTPAIPRGRAALFVGALAHPDFALAGTVFSPATEAEAHPNWSGCSMRLTIGMVPLRDRLE